MILGIDIGGTYLRYEIRKDGVVQKKDSVKSSIVILKDYIENVLKNEKKIKDISISFAGQVKDGVILASPNIEIENFDIKTYFEDKYSVSLFIENDLNCAVLAEANFFNSSDIAALYLGSGLGLGVFSASRLIKGFQSMATELGHIPYKSSPFRCGCGKSNCLELFASGLALERYKEYYKIDKAYTLKELQTYELYDMFIEALLHAVGTTITLFNPEILVLGGGIMQNNPYLHEIILSKIEAYAMPITLKNIKIINTQLNNASLEGAFLLKEYYA